MFLYTHIFWIRLVVASVKTTYSRVGHISNVMKNINMSK